MQLSTNGGSTFPNVLYTNSSASLPNPPDLTLGTWVAIGPCSGQALTTFSGDVQSGLTLVINDYNKLSNLLITLNPVNNRLKIQLKETLEKIVIYSLLGE